MRHLLILLAMMATVAMASPWFWTVLAMQFSAAPVVYENRDGTIQPALIGPASPWPAWALVPADATFSVEAAFGPDGSNAGTGFGTFATQGAPAKTISTYIEALETAGWRTATYYQEVPMLTLLRLCTVHARPRDPTTTRAIQAHFELEAGRTRGRIHWVVGTLPIPAGASQQSCMPANGREN